MSLFSVRLLNTAHDGYFRAKRCLVKGEQMVEVTAAELAQLEADPRITVISVSDVQPETPDTCGDTSGDVVSELVSVSVTAEESAKIEAMFIQGVVEETTAEPAEGECIGSFGAEPIPAPDSNVEKPKKGGKR